VSPTDRPRYYDSPGPTMVDRGATCLQSMEGTFTDHIDTPRPVFIIGSYRSGTSVMTWALGQHPNLFPLEETHFVYKLAVDLDYLYELGARPGLRSFIGLAQLTSREFRTHFGRACSDLIESSRQRTVSHAGSEEFLDKRTINIDLKFSTRDPKRRWIDGTPENAHYVLALLRMFPAAKFIHILRNPKQVAASLMHFSSAGGRDYKEEEAYCTWTQMVQACALAEGALGSERVLRLRYDDIVAEPEATMRRCLAFVGEEFNDDCLLPLREKINSSRYDNIGDDSIEANIGAPEPWISKAFGLYRQLLEERQPSTGRLSALRHLQHKLHDYQSGLRPDENERLAAELDRVRARLKLLGEAPMRILDWGPRDIVAGQPFNVQPDGSNALWIKTHHAPLDTVVEVDGVALESSVHSSGEWLTASVPAKLTSQPCRLELTLRSAGTGEVGRPLFCEPTSRNAIIRRLIHRIQGKLAL
jgi:hypothetical protein